MNQQEMELKLIAAERDIRSLKAQIGELQAAVGALEKRDKERDDAARKQNF